MSTRRDFSRIASLRGARVKERDVGYDAIIIGGGPAGATAALMLARAGWSVAIIEKKTFPRRKVCGEFISATSMPLLHELGVLDDFLQVAGPEVRRVGLFAQDCVLASPMPQPRNIVERWGRALSREHLDLILLEAAQRAGADVWQPWIASELRRSECGYVCTITTMEKSKELAAPIVIAAHGSWESGTLPTQSTDHHHSSDLLAFKAHFRDCDLPPDLMPLIVFPGGYGGMVWSDGGRVSLSCCIRRDELRRCRQQWEKQRAGDAVLGHIQQSCAGVRWALKRATLDGAWLSAGPIRPGIRNGVANGIFLVGNSAGEAHPIVAEGISMALQSAGLLCRHMITRQDEIAAGRGLTEIGRAYSREWKRSFAPRIYAAWLFANLAMSETATDFLLPIITRFPGILTAGANLSGKANLVFAKT
jgi:flavin-dependent dehydrogenase